MEGGAKMPTELVKTYLEQVEGYGEDYSLADLINSKLRQEEIFSERDMTVFHPSSVGYCARKVAADMIGTFPKEQIEERILRVFQNGHSSHERIQNWFDEMGILVEEEKRLTDDELNIKGNCDGVLELGDEGLFVLEIKTISAKGYRYLKEPKPKHYAQIQLYMHLAEIHKGILFYECKDDQRIKEFKVEYDEDFVQELIEKIKWINECVANQELPDRQYEKNSFDCRYCEYRKTICWPDED